MPKSAWSLWMMIIFKIEYKVIRGVDSPTDVLSFAMLEGESFPREEEVILGDVIIFLKPPKRQAREFGHSFQREVAYLTLHGVLHLLGYDHQEVDRRRMRKGKKRSWPAWNCPGSEPPHT